MRKHHSRIIKFSFAKQAHKRQKESSVTYFGAMGSARDYSNIVMKNAVDCLKIMSISPLKPQSPESQQQARNAQNFRINRGRGTPSPVKKRTEESPIKGILYSRGSITDTTFDTKDSRHQEKVEVLKERLQKKEQEKEKEIEEILKLTKQQQYNLKEEISRHLKQQTLLTEGDKTDIPKTSIGLKRVQREQLSDIEKKKISMYFRYKIFSLAKLIEERMRTYNSGVRSAKPSRVKLTTMGKFLPTSVISSPVASRLQAENIYPEEMAIIDEIWKVLKVTASTRSKYRFRDVINYNKRLRETMKTLFPANVPTVQKVNANVNLEDETPTKGGCKKYKSEEEKNQAWVEFMRQKRENPDLKVFIMIGTYPALQRALESRGWIENPDHTSKDFHLKWTSKVIDIKYDALKPHQYVNHYENNISVTTKVGLARNIRNLVWYENEDIDTFYPRCYDLNDVNDFDDFLEDFKFEQAITTLRLADCKKEDISAPTYNLFKVKLCLALNVCERRLKSIDTLLNNFIKNENPVYTQEEWELMNAQEADNVFLEGSKYNRLVKALKTSFEIEFDDPVKPETDEALFGKAKDMLANLEKEFLQVPMNQGKNIWIVKPAGLSRGRANVLDHIKIKESEWVAQKYIENPLIIKNRKFDIRQWVLVTDWNPLTIWFYDECYARFTAQDFNPEDLTNKFAHLTNNAIARNAENFDTSEIEGNMWDSNELRAFLQESTGTDMFEETIKPQMKNIIIKSLKSAPEMVDSRKNTFELFGYDFMIDENYKTWLIEINSSPCMEYSTKITERLVQNVLEDCVKVVVDYGMSRNRNKKGVSTGCFSCIYSGKMNWSI